MSSASTTDDSPQSLLIAGLAALWFSREEIADDIIVQELESLGLEAEYEVASIGPNEQILRNLVVGDPQQPDLTIEEYREGELSFGALDPVIFTDSEEPFALPAYDIAIRDGRALMQSDFGDVGLKVEGEGPLDTGFNGPRADQIGFAHMSRASGGAASIGDGYAAAHARQLCSARRQRLYRG